MHCIFSFLIAPSHLSSANEGGAPNRSPPPQEVDEMRQEAPLQAANPIEVSNIYLQYMKI